MLSVSEYKAEVGGKGKDDYSVFRKPGGNADNNFENLSKQLISSGAFKVPTTPKTPPAGKPTSGNGNDKGGM